MNWDKKTGFQICSENQFKMFHCVDIFISTSWCMKLIKFVSRFLYFYFSIIFRISIERQILGNCNIILFKRLLKIALTKNMHSKTTMVKKYKTLDPVQCVLLYKLANIFYLCLEQKEWVPGLPSRGQRSRGGGLQTKYSFLHFFLICDIRVQT